MGKKNPKFFARPFSSLQEFFGCVSCLAWISGGMFSFSESGALHGFHVESNNVRHMLYGSVCTHVCKDVYFSYIETTTKLLQVVAARRNCFVCSRPVGFCVSLPSLCPSSINSHVDT